jgi:hypothetical protein
MILNEIPEKYDNFSIAQCDIALTSVEWYSFIGDMAFICIQSLKKAKEDLQKKGVGKWQ